MATNIQSTPPPPLVHCTCANHFKALVLLEFLVKNGSERVVDDARTHIATIKILRNFHFIDDKGKDQGINGIPSTFKHGIYGQYVIEQRNWQSYFPIVRRFARNAEKQSLRKVSIPALEAMKLDSVAQARNTV